HRLTVEVDLFGTRARELHDVVTRPGGDHVSVANRHGFDDVKLRIDREDFAVVPDVAWRRLAMAGGTDKPPKEEQAQGAFLHGQRLKGKGKREKGKGGNGGNGEPNWPKWCLIHNCDA